MSKKVKIPVCRGPYFEVIVNGMRYRYQAGQTVEVPDGIAALIEKHIEEHDTPPAVPEMDVALTLGQLVKSLVLDKATEQTHALVEHNGATMRLPLNSLGGSRGSGATIHISMDNPLEGSNEEVPEFGYEKYDNLTEIYKVGDYVFFAPCSCICEVFETDTSADDLHWYGMTVVWKPTETGNDSKPIPIVDGVYEPDELTAVLTDHGDFIGQIVVHDCTEDEGSNGASAAYMYLGEDINSNPIWKKITE